MTAAEPFSILGQLPTGTTVLEASAGTGKTFTIAALVARYVTEGVASMDDLLVVSFSRESTRELRERVRERLVSTRDGLAEPAAVDPRDEVLTLLATGSPAEVDARRRRSQQALASFDSATVTTTHGFCQQVLAALGTAGDHDPGAQLLENVADLVREVADDLYVRKWGHARAAPAQLTVQEFRRLALDVTTDPATRLVPDADPSSLPGLRARIAHAVRAEVDVRKRRSHLFDYDDLLSRLASTLHDPSTGAVAVRRLRDRYRIVLVDEFQDTDPVQWSILRAPFHGHRTLVLIGDPKQAIYGFRGADVHAYLAARQVADTVRTLPTSFRSDAGLGAGLDAVLRSAALGDPRIRVTPVESIHRGRMVDVAGHAASVRLRVLTREGRSLNGKNLVAAGEATGAVVADLTAEVIGLLDGGADLTPRDGGPQRPLLPGDVAVLVRTNTQAQQVSAGLRAAAVPVVVTGRTSVFATAAADEWQLLLEALEQPHRTARVARLALGSFVGRDAAEVAAGADTVVADLALRVRVWARLFDERGVAAVFEAVSAEQALQARLLGVRDGERLLTDLRHLAQVLHEVAAQERRGLRALVTWLRRRRDEAATESGLERSRRLDSDAAAVQVITVHTSKGLEFPVVLMPFAWSYWPGHEPSTAVFHDTVGERVRDVGGRAGADWASHLAMHQRESADDELRLAYVGLTRAMSHLVLWWAPTANTAGSALQRLLMHDDPTTVAPHKIPVPSDAVALAAFRSRADDHLAVEVIGPRPAHTYAAPAPTTSPLSVATLERGLDTTWRRTSYSALTASAHDAPPRFGSEPEVRHTQDEGDSELMDDTGLVDSEGAGIDATLRTVPSAWDALPGGAGFGTLVHAALETIDDVGDETGVRETVASQVSRAAPGTDVDVLTTALTVAASTPLGPLARGAALRDLHRTDRLPELDFEMPLSGGDEPLASRPVLDDLVPLWRRHCGAGVLSAYADRLATLDAAPLRGYLTGSIDVVLRVWDDGTPRYLVVDYKTNRLGGYDEPLTAWHYRPEAMEAAMIEAHYPLQALLYSVALHRYLRWRQPRYDPAVHLGGSLYLFLRGMSGPGVTAADGSVPGVFAWRPPTALVTGASDLLAGAP